MADIKTILPGYACTHLKPQSVMTDFWKISVSAQ
jgi:hypothetical protein